jgi:hypothetical protein
VESNARSGKKRNNLFKIYIYKIYIKLILLQRHPHVQQSALTMACVKMDFAYVMEDGLALIAAMVCVRDKK